MNEQHGTACQCDRCKMQVMPMSTTVRDNRDLMRNREREACRCCGSLSVHSKNYGHPTADCMIFMRQSVAQLTADLETARAEIERLRGNGWTPIEAGLPDRECRYLVSTPAGTVDAAVWSLDRQRFEKPGFVIPAIAWAPLPTPFVEGGE